jgi:hypothetical protein
MLLQLRSKRLKQSTAVSNSSFTNVMLTYVRAIFNLNFKEDLLSTNFPTCLL